MVTDNVCIIYRWRADEWIGSAAIICALRRHALALTC